MSTFPGAFVPVAPPADGLRLAFVAARRRRNRKAGATGAVGLLAAVALLASTGGSGNRTLLQEPLPPASTSGLGVVSGARPSPEPNPAMSAAATDPAGTAAAAAGATAMRMGHGNDSVVTTVDGAGASRSRRLGAPSAKAVSGPMGRSYGYGYSSDLICPARKQQEGGRKLCTDVSAYQSSTGVVSITAEVCNAGTATEVLTFNSQREIDLSVRRSGLDVWRWSLGRHFAAVPHDATLPVGECLMWSTKWTQVDGRGVPVKNGSYDVVADFDADEVAAPDRHPTYPITITQQP